MTKQIYSVTLLALVLLSSVAQAALPKGYPEAFPPNQYPVFEMLRQLYEDGVWLGTELQKNMAPMNVVEAKARLQALAKKVMPIHLEGRRRADRMNWHYLMAPDHMKDAMDRLMQKQYRELIANAVALIENQAISVKGVFRKKIADSKIREKMFTDFLHDAVKWRDSYTSDGVSSSGLMRLLLQPVAVGMVRPTSPDYVEIFEAEKCKMVLKGDLPEILK